MDFGRELDRDHPAPVADGTLPQERAVSLYSDHDSPRVSRLGKNSDWHEPCEKFAVMLQLLRNGDWRGSRSNECDGTRLVERAEGIAG